MDTIGDEPEGLEERFDQLVSAYGQDPMEVLFDFLDEDEDDRIRFGAAKELMQYRYPKKKALEVKADHTVEIVLTDFNEGLDSEDSDIPMLNVDTTSDDPPQVLEGLVEDIIDGDIIEDVW